MKEEPKKAKFVAGAHSLSTMFTIKDATALEAAMRTTVRHGGSLFEIVFLLCQLPWDDISRLALETGIEEISLCHFWPKNADGTAPHGDPLGTIADERKALNTIKEILAAVEIIRSHGVTVRFIDGPLWGGLGWQYEENPEVLEKRVVRFLQLAHNVCAAHNVILAVEFLRPEEGRVVRGTKHMLKILKAVNAHCEDDDSSVMMHFDVFHSLAWNENPSASIEKARHAIAYLHIHGNNRIAPGGKGDCQDWRRIVEAMKLISFPGAIPVVSEPFGEETRRENPALGQGLPPTPELDRYLGQAWRTLRFAGLSI